MFISVGRLLSSYRLLVWILMCRLNLIHVDITPFFNDVQWCTDYWWLQDTHIFWWRLTFISPDYVYSNFVLLSWKKEHLSDFTTMLEVQDLPEVICKLCLMQRFLLIFILSKWTCWNDIITLWSFLLHIITSLLMHEFSSRSRRCGVSRIMALVLLVFISNCIN